MVSFDDVMELGLTQGNCHVVGIEVEYNTQIYGLEVRYRMGQGLIHTRYHIGRAPGPRYRVRMNLAQDEYIVQVRGSYGLAVEWLRMSTNKGQVVDVGGRNGSEFELSIPSQYGVMGFKGGVGGYLQSFGVILKSTSVPVTPMTVHPVYGKTHIDTRTWDDLSLISECSYSHISELRLISNGTYVLGLAVKYLVNGLEVRSSGLHLGSDISGRRIEQVLIFDANEVITHIEGRFGAVIDYLRVVTDKGREASVGGSGGSAFTVEIPANKRIIAFGGGVNGHLHNIFLHFG